MCAVTTSGLETEAEMLIGTILVTARVVFRLLRLLSLGRGFRQRQQAADSKHLEVRMAGDDDAMLLDGTSGTGQSDDGMV